MTTLGIESSSQLIKGLREGYDDLLWIIHRDFQCFKYGGNYDATLGINSAVVEVVVTSWIDDLEKYSIYHKDKTGKDCDPDTYKQAAFLMHWISRLKPLQMFSNRDGETYERCQELLRKDKYGMVNEVFAVNVGINRIGVDYEQVYEKYPTIIKELIYQLYFREADPKLLYTTLELLHVVQLVSSLAPEVKLSRNGMWQIETPSAIKPHDSPTHKRN